MMYFNHIVYLLGLEIGGSIASMMWEYRAIGLIFGLRQIFILLWDYVTYKELETNSVVTDMMLVIKCS